MKSFHQVRLLRRCLERTTTFEAEWDGIGDVPSDQRLIRNFGECPEKLVKKVRDHFIKLKEAIETGKHLSKGGYFSDFEKYSDMWQRIKVIPENVTFPKECGSLYLRADLKAEISNRKNRKKARK